MPLRLGAPELFRRVRSSLQQASYDEAALCSVLKIPSLHLLGTLRREEIDLKPVGRKLALFIRLLLLGDAVLRDEFEAGVDSETRNAFLELDLLRLDEASGGTYFSPVFVYTVEGFVVASDRQTNPDGSAFSESPDMVFAALFPGTRQFLRILPSGGARDALDLCSGTGIGAFKLSRFARHVVATDITGRSAHFIRFNAALNGCDNVEARTGDLFDAVTGRQFDLITAHPPYVPSLGDDVVYRDGGETGERILRRIIEGLPGALRSGGMFFGMGVGLDTTHGAFETRVRGWLGESNKEFDIIFAYGDEKSPDKAVHDLLERARNIRTADRSRLTQAFQDSGATRLVYGALVIRRRAAGEDADPWTARPRLSSATIGQDFTEVFDLHRRTSCPGFVESLAGAKPVLSPHLQVKATHAVQNGSLVPVDFVFEVQRPFANATRLDPWAVPLVARFDGKETVTNVHAQARSAGTIPAGFELSDFLALLALLIERGYVVMPEWETETGGDDPDDIDTGHVSGFSKETSG